MAERSLNGKVELHYPPSGVTWRLSCPVANALDRISGERETERKGRARTPCCTGPLQRPPATCAALASKQGKAGAIGAPSVTQRTHVPDGPPRGLGR
jgi:hypothetical protein